MIWDPDEAMVEDFTNGYCWLLSWALIHEAPEMRAMAVAQIHELYCPNMVFKPPSVDWTHTVVYDPSHDAFLDVTGWSDITDLDQWWELLDTCDCAPEHMLVELPANATTWARMLQGDPTDPAWISVLDRAYPIARDLLALPRGEAA